MKCIVIIGNGGREESIRWKLSEETSSTALHVSMLANDDNLKLNENLKEDDLVVVVRWIDSDYFPGFIDLILKSLK